MLLLVLIGGASTTTSAADAGGSGVVTADAQQAAQAVMKSGRLVSCPCGPDHVREIQWVAEGSSPPKCGVDTRIVQVLQLLVEHFTRVGVSDINRQCTGQVEGAGYQSPHWLAGGGHAVDIYMLNGQDLSGRDVLSVEAIRYLDPHMPVGSRIGQVECGSGFVSGLAGFTTQFSDTCTHLHIDVLYAQGAVK